MLPVATVGLHPEDAVCYHLPSYQGRAWATGEPYNVCLACWTLGGQQQIKSKQTKPSHLLLHVGLGGWWKKETHLTEPGSWVGQVTAYLPPAASRVLPKPDLQNHPAKMAPKTRREPASFICRVGEVWGSLVALFSFTVWCCLRLGSQGSGSMDD